jgi:ABC-type multidrug transport system fused ATPase/permease subunit
MVKDADWILVLEEGQLVESGTPAHLISSGGWFATLAEGTGQEAEEVET